MKAIKHQHYAQTLIEAVQAGSPTGLMTKVFRIQAQQENGAGRVTAISAGLPLTGITALHVACRLYSLATTPAERENREAIVQILIERGAFLTVEATIHGRKQTPLDVCEGNAPQILIDAIKQNYKRLNSETKHFSATIHQKSLRTGIDEDELEKMSSGYAFYYGGMRCAL